MDVNELTERKVIETFNKGNVFILRIGKRHGVLEYGRDEMGLWKDLRWSDMGRKG